MDKQDDQDLHRSDTHRVTPAGKRGDRIRMLRAVLDQLEPGTATYFYTI